MKRRKVRTLPVVKAVKIGAGLGVLVLSAPQMPVAHAQGAKPDAAPAAPATTTPAAPDADNKAQAIAAYNSGLEAVRKGDWNGAAAQFEKAVGLDAKDTSSYMFLGYVRLKQEKFDAALTALQTAERIIAPADGQGKATLYNNLGLVYWNKNMPTEAIAAYKNALKFDAQATDAQYNLAFALLAQKRYPEATPLLDGLTKTSKDPALLGALYDALGEAYENQKDWAKALGAYSKAIDQRPDEAAYHLHKGLALINSNRKSDAVKSLLEVARLDPQSTDPQSAEAFLQLGAIFIEQKRFPEAQKNLNSYVALRPKDALGWYNLGVAYDYTGRDFDKALRAYEKAREFDAKNAAVCNNVGRIYFKQNRLDDAVRELKQAIELDEKSFDAHHNLAFVFVAQAQVAEKKADEAKGKADFAEQKRFNDEAKAKYEAANTEWGALLNTVEPQWRQENDADRKAQLAALVVGARAGRAENNLAQKLYPAAITEYKLLVAAAPENITAKINLGLAYYFANNYAEAEKLYREITKADPKNATAFNNMGAVLEAKNDREGAITAYRKALELKPDYSEAKNNLDRLVKAAKVG